MIKSEGGVRMPGQSGSKLKILYLKHFFEEYTDAEHGATLADMQAYLDNQGIQAERKALYRDIELLREFGMDIVQSRAKKVEYRLVSRAFELPELKLLVDAVGASKFITRKKSLSLIDKLETLCSRYEARQLDRSVYVDQRVKTMNESIFYTVDTIYSALRQRKKLSFKYFTYTPNKQRVLRRSGKVYQVTPLSLTYSEENYYLYAFDSEHGEVRTYRVDRMTAVTCLEEAADKNDKISEFNPANYAREQFSMFGGTTKKVTLYFDNDLCTVVLDRFGQDVILVPDGGGFRVTVDVMVSPTFLGWICGFAGRAAVLAPEEVCREMRDLLRKVARAGRQEEAEEE